MNAHRNWMYGPRNKHERNNREYGDKVHNFISVAYAKVGHSDEMYCPCARCRNYHIGNRAKIFKHIIENGFVEGYWVWHQHGEVFPGSSDTTMPTYSDVGSCSTQTFGFADLVNDRFPDMDEMDVPEMEGTDEAVEDGFCSDHSRPIDYDYYQLIIDASTPVMDDSPMSLLQFCSQFISNKSQHFGSQALCDNMLKLFYDTLPPGDKKDGFPATYAKMKRLMQGIECKHLTYDVCINSDFLYYKENSVHTACPVCNEPRYKPGTNIPRKKLWHFPITDRLQQLYLNPRTAEAMTWHKQCVGSDANAFIHPAGGAAWKQLDEMHPQIASDHRNVRLGLSTDGFNPFGTGSYSSWPVFLTPYNLPPEKCMKPDTIFLSLLISGPYSPKVNIDVMLRPLIDELKDLYNHGAKSFDSFTREVFTMRAALLWTISDFPAYGMLSGWGTQGRLACPYCMENTKAFTLTNSRKTCWFDCHRQFLDSNHRYRRNRKDFIKGRVERTINDQERPDGIHMYNAARVHKSVEWPERLSSSTNHEQGRYGEGHHWTKRSIFWELPYWKDLLIRHNLDVMHIEKNIFDNIFRTVMGDSNNSKDHQNAREDIKEWCDRPELHMNTDETMPPAAFTLNKVQCKIVCKWLKGLKFPDGHASNLGRCANVKAGTISGMKSHDCHVFMHRLLPVAFREFLPPHIYDALSEVSLFFRAICNPVIKKDEMEALGKSIIVTICNLEKKFPPSFFDSMEHLAIHLPYEAKVGGPVYYRWMYPFERRMYVLKSYVKNRSRVEGSICSAYLIQEIANFCAQYFGKDVDTAINRKKRNEVLWKPEFDGQLSTFHPMGKHQGAGHARWITDVELNSIQYYLITNCAEAEKFVRRFNHVYSEGRTALGLATYRMDNLVGWFKKQVNAIYKKKPDSIHPGLLTLAGNPVQMAQSYPGYKCNGFNFQTEDYCTTKQTTNCDVSLICTMGEGEEELIYYGTLTEILKLSYDVHTSLPQCVFLFNCQWYDGDKAVKIQRRTGLVDINKKKKLITHDSFILPRQAKQVYYVPYPVKDISSVCPIRARFMIDVSQINHSNHDAAVESSLLQDDRPPSLIGSSSRFVSRDNVYHRGEGEEVEVVTGCNDVEEVGEGEDYDADEGRNDEVEGENDTDSDS